MSDFSDVTFLDHHNGWWGSVLFCDLSTGTIHLNALPNKSLKNIWWFVENSAQGLSHETLHLVLLELEGEETSRALQRIDAPDRWNISNFSQFKENDE